MLFCCVAGCPEVPVVQNHGLCRSHYHRLRRYGDPTAGGPSRPRVAKGRPAQDHEDGSRTCNTCGQRKPLADYPKDANATRGHRTHCKPCHTAKELARYHADPEAGRERQRQMRVRNADRVREQDRARYERDKPKRIELATDHGHRRRARMLGLPEDPGINVRALRKRDGDQCHYCKVVMDFAPATGRIYRPLKATVEHVLPLSRGGFHVWENVALACWQCNLRKNAKTASEWAA